MGRKNKARKLEAAAKSQHPGLFRRADSESVQAVLNAHPQADSSRVGPSTQRPVCWLAPLLIALLTLTAFLPALHNQFVAWDDDKNFLDNPYYRGLGWAHLRWMWTTFHMGHYAPLTWMTLGLDHLLWGMNPLGYHLTSLLLHAANAVVFYFVVLRILTPALPRLADRGHALVASAGFAALLFAIHPLRVESVAWITERRDVLSGLFYLLTILVYLRACEREECSRRWYWLSVAVFACALLSKSMAVSLPVVLVILDAYPLRRLGGSLGWWSEPSRRVYAEKIPFVLLAAVASAAAFKAQVVTQSIASLAQLSVPGRLAVCAYGLSFYLWKMLVPSNLSPLYELPPKVNPAAMPFILSYGLVLAVTAIAVALRRRVPGLQAVWVAYVVILLPVLGIFQNGPQIAADRYTYLAGFGWATLAGAGLLFCWRPARRSQTGASMTLPLAGIAIGGVVGLGVLTWNQVEVWHDSARLWSYIVSIDPDSAIAQKNFGDELTLEGKLVEATEHFQRALRIRPDYANAHDGLGVALDGQGNSTEAIEHFREALRLGPDNADAHNNWGVALGHQGKLAEAVEHYERALSLKPDLVAAENNWGAALADQGNSTEATKHFQQALRLKPDFAEAHNNLGLALAHQSQVAGPTENVSEVVHTTPALMHTDRAVDRQRKLVEALDHFQHAVRLKPDYAEAHANWGAALIAQGKAVEAIEHFREALRIHPSRADAHYNWGVALRAQGKPAEAIEHFREALRIHPDLAEARDALGQALAQHGKLGETKQPHQQAPRLEPDFAEAHNNLGVALARQGKLAEAIAHFQQALLINPDDAIAHTNWGRALAQQGKLAEAEEHYRHAQRLKGVKVE